MLVCWYVWGGRVMDRDGEISIIIGGGAEAEGLKWGVN